MDTNNQLIPNNIDHRLDNWRRWCQESRRPKTCASIERLWRPGVWGDESDLGPPRPKPIPVDPHDAERVHQAWRSLPDRHKWLLKWVYVGTRKTAIRSGVARGFYQLPPFRWIFRQLRLKGFRDYKFALYAAKSAITKRLDTEQKITYAVERKINDSGKVAA